MKAAATLVSLVAMAGVALSQGVTSAIAPVASSPAACSASYDGTFEITVAEVTIQKRNEPIAKRAACATTGTLVANLTNGVLTDAKGRTGYIASNYQFQFDDPPQAGAIYTAGFSVCTNGSLALGDSEVFYECLSGDFYNLYDRNWAAQCSPVEIIVLPCGGDTSEANDGQVVGTQIVTTTIVSLLSDGQPQVKTTTTGVPLCQISQIGDGQVQVATTPCASITTTVNTATSTLAPVSQYSDGQIQVTPAASVPTVTAASATTTAPVVSGSGSVVTVPSESVPVTGGSSTLATTKASGTASVGSSATSSSPSTGTSAPASSGAAAGSMKMGSMAALMVGLIGAVAFL